MAYKIKVFGITMPNEIKDRNFTRTFKDWPVDSIIDDDIELKDYDQAVERQRAVFEEEGIYRNNYFFLKLSILRLRREALKPLRKAWAEAREKNWATRYECKEYKAITAAKKPFAKAARMNRRIWREYSEMYELEMAEISDAVEELWEKREQERIRAAEAERKRKAEEKRKAADAELTKRKNWSPEYRKAMEERERKLKERNRRSKEARDEARKAWIAKLQQMTTEEYEELIEKEMENPAFKKATSRWNAEQLEDYRRQQVEEWQKAVDRWRWTGKPLGTW